MRLDRARHAARAIWREIRAEKLTFLAGSIAYHAFVSLLPLFVLLVAAISTIDNTTLEAGFRRLMRALVTEGTWEVVRVYISRSSASISLIGLFVLLWGTLRIFRGLDTAFSDIYETSTANTFADQLLDGAVVLVAFALALLTAGAVEALLPAPGDSFLAWAVRRLLLVAGLMVTFYPMYYVFPDTDVGVVEVLPGVAVAAVGVTAFESLFKLYVTYAGRTPSQESAIAGVLIFLTWLYFSGLVVLVGATVNAVLSNRSRDVDIDPVFGGWVHTGTDNARLADSLSRLKQRIEGSEMVVVSVDGEVEEITVPSPDEVTVRDGSRGEGDPDEATGTTEGPTIELRWDATDRES